MDGTLSIFDETSSKYNKNAFQSKPTSHLPIETQTLTIWPWNDLDLDMILTWLWPWPQLSHTKSNWCRGSKISIFYDDLDLAPMTLIPKLDLDIVKIYHHTKNWSSYVNCLKSYSPKRQTHGQTDWHTHTDTHRHYENITSTAYAGGKYGFCIYYAVIGLIRPLSEDFP